MKRWTVMTNLALSLALAAPAARAAEPGAPTAPVTEPVAAATEPAPKFEMRQYVVGFLYRGEKWSPEATPERAEIQKGHMANIERLAREGHLVLAGPFTDDGDLRGLFVFKVETVEEAKALCDTDPAVKTGRLRVELHPWYGPAGLKVTPTAEPEPLRATQPQTK